MIYLEMNHVRKSFGDLEVLKDISLEVNKGDVLSIIGPSGSGKSTLLRCAVNLEKISGGKIEYNDKLMADTNENGIVTCLPMRTVRWTAAASFHCKSIGNESGYTIFR